MIYLCNIFIDDQGTNLVEVKWDKVGENQNGTSNLVEARWDEVGEN